MNDSESNVIRFAGFTLDLVLGRLLVDRKDVVLRPKCFALLSYLVRGNGRVITKDELMSVLWPDVVVTEDSLTRCVHDVRQALGPSATLLRTIPRRGYLFKAPLPVVPPPPADALARNRRELRYQQARRRSSRRS